MEQINENSTVTMHQAELYLRNEENPTSLYVRIEGKRRRLFINRSTGLIGIIAIGKRNRGYLLHTLMTGLERLRLPTQRSLYMRTALLQVQQSTASAYAFQRLRSIAAV